MPAARSFTDLQYWQRTRAWSKGIYYPTQKPRFARDQRLVSANQRLVRIRHVQHGRRYWPRHARRIIRFLGYAIGSPDETQSRLCAAYNCYPSKDQLGGLWQEEIEIRTLTVAFIRSMILPHGGVRTLGRPPTWSSRVWELYEHVTGQPRPAMFDEPMSEEPAPSRNDKPPI